MPSPATFTPSARTSSDSLDLRDSKELMHLAALLRHRKSREGITMNRAIVLALMLIVMIAPLAGSAQAEPNTDEVIEQAP